MKLGKAMPKATHKPSKFEKQAERVFQFFIGHTLLWGGGAAVITAAAIWFIQVFGWLEHGRMPVQPLSLVWLEVFGNLPVIEWKGVEKIVYWVLNQNAGLASFLLGVLLVPWGWGMLWLLKEEKVRDELSQQ